MNRLVTASVVAIVLLGCNAILKNEPGTLANEEETTTNNPTNPPASSSSGDTSSSGGTTTPPGTSPITGDAGQPTTPPDGGQCATGQMLCNNACVSITDPLYGCGNPACTPCSLDHAASACQGRTCVVATCDTGFSDCDKNPANGCEVDLSKATSCGACNAVCPATAPVCAPSAGGFACTTGCPATAPLLCGAECVDPQTSENHCGGCNIACPMVANGTSECASGQCTFTCGAGFNRCGTECKVATDPAACGPTCAVCPTPTNATPLCSNNACTYQCNAGFADCNTNPADGCEAVLATDAANCGVCGNVCPVGSTCQGGACTQPPPPEDAGAPPP
jgi:hypothetical protein